ncbi:hypothetical protein ABE060_22175 [Bacillus rugosus]|uniref:hypothetical protein n=1 Tax=Bacillus rugosus TaxID=2715209 RepID=UPI0015845315|nr:hypothetical protein [Bacillus rugosus]NUF07770.1 hypothetical protein [Bacillus rugosus]
MQERPVIFKRKITATCFLFFLLGLLFFLDSEFNKVEAASYSPYDVNMNGVNSATQGNRAASFTSGKKLVYDVYDGKDGKESWKVVNRDYGKGKQPYLEFSGWSAIVGYTHHTKDNQDTYFYLTNNKNEKRVYKAEQLSSVSASKDIEYNRKSETGSINNPCSSSAHNKNNDECNMYYNAVGFKAHIPLNDLFGEGIDDDNWTVQIVKRVENHYIYDDLRVPFEFNLNYSNGVLQLSSGLDAKNLKMGYEGVARRDFARQGGYSGGRYFTKGDTYTAKSTNQESTVVWYGVKTPEEQNKTKWAASLYWIFGGERATLRYNVTTVNVNIVHKDKDTGKILKSEKTKGTVGKTYSYAPENKGTFKDENGADYVPVSKAKSGKIGKSDLNITFEYQVPSQKITVVHKDKDTGKILRTDSTSQKVGTSYSKKPENRGVFKGENDRPYVPISKAVSGKVPEKGVTITFEYRLSVPAPNTGGEIEGSKDGDAALKGEVSWSLYKKNNGDKSYLRYVNDLSVKGKHYATKNINKKITTALINKTQSTDEKLLIENQEPNKMKNKDIEYTLTYEYTNFYKDVYAPKEFLGDDVFVWEKIGTKADWSKSKKTDKTITLKAEHSYGGKLEFSRDGMTEKGFITGEYGFIDGSISKDKEYFASNTSNKIRELQTQAWMSFLKEGFYPQYSVTLKQREQDPNMKVSHSLVHGKVTAFYYPNDLDGNLKGKFANQTEDKLTKYAIPLTIIGKQPNEKANPFIFRSAEDFYITKNTGFVDSIKDNENASKKIKEDYEKYTSQSYNDTILSKNHGLSADQIKQNGGGYYLPIDSESNLKTDKEYTDWIVVQNMGLNDLKLMIPQTYKFKHYLIGAAGDDPIFNEQSETPVAIGADKYPNTVTINNEQRQKILKKDILKRDDLLYGFKAIDIKSISSLLKNEGLNP